MCFCSGVEWSGLTLTCSDHLHPIVCLPLEKKTDKSFCLEKEKRLAVRSAHWKCRSDGFNSAPGVERALCRAATGSFVFLKRFIFIHSSLCDKGSFIYRRKTTGVFTASWDALRDLNWQRWRNETVTLLKHSVVTWIWTTVCKELQMNMKYFYFLIQLYRILSLIL